MFCNRVGVIFKIIISFVFCSTLCFANGTFNTNSEISIVSDFKNNNTHPENLIKINGHLDYNCNAVFKDLQTILISPHYPLNYPAEVNCQYEFRSPYKCLSEYHIQFLDFDLESSRNCQNDFLDIENIEVLCGRITGARKYNTSDGILKLKFRTNKILEAKGFKLLITRQQCDDYYRNFTSETSKTIKHEKDDPYLYTRKETNNFNLNNGDRETPRYNILPVKDSNSLNNTKSRQYLPTANGYLPIHPGNQNPSTNYGNEFRPQTPFYQTNPFLNPSFWCYSHYLPQSPLPTQRPYYYPHPSNDFPSKEIPQQLFPVQPQNNFPRPIEYPTNQLPNHQPQPSQKPIYPVFQPNYNPPNNFPQYPIYSRENLAPNQIPTWLQYNFTRPQAEPQFNPILLDNLPSCCANTFASKRFLLTSPGFPVNSASNSPRDCIFYIEKFGPNVCRLRIVMKYFSLGQQVGNNCFNDFIEIDGRRICGCRSGLVYTSQWGYGAKLIRLRTTGYQNPFENNGFVFDIIQEDCPFRYSRSYPIIEKRSDIYGPPHAIIQTNSTTHIKYYLTDDQRRQLQNDEFTRRESPNSQFIYPKQLSLNSCRIASNDFQQIFYDRLWISKPVCRAPN